VDFGECRRDRRRLGDVACQREVLGFWRQSFDDGTQRRQAAAKGDDAVAAVGKQSGRRSADP
jgi:hypothetical protein